MKVGIEVTCRICGLQKKPRGRSAPVDTVMCESHIDGGGCIGYYEEPRVGDLWPGETEEDFGYPVTVWGTRETSGGLTGSLTDKSQPTENNGVA